MKIIIYYFKPSGKFYSEAEYYTNKKYWDVPDELRTMRDTGKLPGLVPNGGKTFHMYINTDPETFPMLITNDSVINTREYRRI